MKKYDKEALKKAFDIPDPQHKEEFLNQLNIKKNNPKRRIPIFMRYASMAAFAAIMVSIVTNLSLTADFPDQFTSDKTIIPTISSSVTTAVTTEETPTATTVATVEGDQILIQTTVATEEFEIITATAAYETPAETTAAESSESPPTAIVTKPPNTLGNHTATTTAKTNSTKLTQQTTPAKTTTQTVQLEPEPTTTTKKDPPQTTPQTSKTVPPTTTPHDNNIQTTLNPQSVTTTKIINPPPLTTTVTVTVPTPSKDNDLTVRPTSVYTPSDMIIDKYEFDYEHDLMIDAPIPNDPSDITTTVDGITTEKLFNDSAFIFRGIIEEKIYTDVLGQPYTIENIVITDIPKSQNKFYSENDKISICVPGGYMPVHIYANAHNVDCDYPDNYMIYSNGGNISTQNVGEEYFFFVNYGTDDMPYGAFQLTTNNDISVFMIDGYGLISLGNSDLTFPFI